MKYFSAFAVAIVFLLMPALCFSEDPGQPNIVLIMADESMRLDEDPRHCKSMVEYMDKSV